MEFADLLVVVVICGFVALCAAYVRWCDQLVGPDPVVADARLAVENQSVEAAAEVTP